MAVNRKFRVTLEVTVPAGELTGNMFDWEDQVARLMKYVADEEAVVVEIIDVNYQTPYPGEEDNF